MHAHTLIYECIKSTAKIGIFYKDLKSNASHDFTQRLYYWTKKVKNLKSNIGFVKDFIHIIFQLVHHHISETNTMSMHVFRSLEAAGFPLFFISGVLTLFPLSLLFFFLVVDLLLALLFLWQTSFGLIVVFIFLQGLSLFALFICTLIFVAGI